MKKEKFLEKYKDLIEDEGLNHAFNKGLKLGDFIVFKVVGIPLAVFSLIMGQVNTVFAILALTFSLGFGKTFSCYRFTKAKIWLFLTIANSLATVFCTLAYITRVLEWW